MLSGRHWISISNATQPKETSKMRMTRTDLVKHKQQYKMPCMLELVDECCENCFFLGRARMKKVYHCGIGKFRVNKIGLCKHWRAK
jgi:hypothetical protein